jgi:hypothetical protein
VLVEAGAELEAQAHQGDTPLHAAAHFGQADAARLLAELGAEVQAKDARGRTPLQISIERGHREVEQVLRHLERTRSAARQAREAANHTPTTQAAIAAMGVRQLKSYLGERGVDFSGCCEKSELLALALGTLAEDAEVEDLSSAASGAVHKACAACGVEAVKLRKCKTCLKVYYCSRECQVADWQAHKLSCGA